MRLDLGNLYPTQQVTVQPVVEPVTVAEALAFAQYEADDQASQEVMQALLVTARRKVEKDAAVALITQTRTLKFDKFPPREQPIRVVPVQSVAISYIDDAGDTQSLSASLFQVDTHAKPPRVAPASGESWPDTETETFNAVTLTVVCGFGDTADDVPAEAKTAIKLLAREWFYNRCATGEVGDGIRGAYGAMVNALSWRPVDV